jgi:hypothetical protein
MKTITIWTNTSDESMVGGEGWTVYDAEASTEEFLKQFANAVAAKFPGYEVEVEGTDYREEIEIDDERDEYGQHIDDDKDLINEIKHDIWESWKWLVKSDIADTYEALGREIAETETYMNSEDAWESEETHRTLSDDDLEIAADAFGMGFVSYTPAELSEVMTAGEVVDVWGFAEATVRQAINRGQIFARKSGGTWLIRRKDAETKWGTPPDHSAAITTKPG